MNAQVHPSLAADQSAGASTAANAKITTGGASTLQSGRTIAITRGVNLDRSDFGGQNLKGVAFQQSIVRDSNFAGSNLVGASFFDATLDGSNFEGAGKYINVEFLLFLFCFCNNEAITSISLSVLDSKIDMSLVNVEMAQFNRANLKVSVFVCVCVFFYFYLILKSSNFTHSFFEKECGNARNVCVGINTL